MREPQAPELTAVFCTLCYPRGQGTCAAFDFDPSGTSPIGSYIPVDVRLYELEDQALMLAVYRPVRRAPVHPPAPS